MRVDSGVFLLFLGCVAVLHAVLPRRWRSFLLLGASLAFYATSSIDYLLLLLVLSVINYTSARWLSRELPSKSRTWIFAASVCLDLAVLVAFKYARGPVGQFLAGSGWMTADEGGVVRLAAPLGVSYFTFQMLACVTDAYRQTWTLERGYVEFLLFSLFFPQISSGPIPRAGHLLPQLAAHASPAAEDRVMGLRMIAYGLFKKYVVANLLSERVSIVFSAAGHVHRYQVALACAFNALQLYADFSGYVDIAIGSARFLGIRLDPNFDRPFKSSSVSELWRRWHMTLSFWLRDYVYMPMLIRIRGLGKIGVAVALVVTFAICGVWHAAAWTYLLFGVCQGVAMSVEFLTKPWRSKMLRAWPARGVALAGNLYTLSFFTLTEVLFRSTNLRQAGEVYRALVCHPAGGVMEQTPALRAHYLVLVCWACLSAFYHRESVGNSPWFVLCCAILILLLGRLGAAHFIYTAF